MEKHLFAGANTMNGFVNLFNNIIDRDNCRFFYILKGGSGVGKSSMLKKIAKYFINLNQDIEYFHCSQDVDSIDGIALQTLKIAFVDGTAPHIVESKYVKCTDFTIDLSTCIDETQLVNKKEMLVKIMNKKTSLYSQAFSNINTASKLVIDLYNTKLKDFDIEKIRRKALNSLDNLTSIKAKSFTRHLFASAISSDGLVYLPSEYNNVSVFNLINNDMASRFFISCLKQLADCYNLKYDLFYNPYTTTLLDGIIIEDQTFYTLNPYVKSNIYSTIDMLEYNKKVNTSIDSSFIVSQIDLFTTKAIQILDEAKKTHLEIEKIYTPTVDFHKVNSITDSIINTIINT